MRGWCAVGLVGFLALVPAASATLTLTLGEQTSMARLMPAVGAQHVEATITMDCQTVWMVGAPAVESTIPITIQATALETLAVQGPSTVLLDTSPCFSSTTAIAKGEAQYLLTANRQTPGLENIPVWLNATGPAAKSVGGQEIYPDQADSKVFQVQVAYYPVIEAKVEEGVLDTKPGGVLTFEVEVSNLGNAQTQVQFALDSKPGDWSATVVPPPLTLDTPNKSGGTTSGSALFSVAAPAKEGWNNAMQVFSLVVTPHAAIDSTLEGTPVHITVFARSSGLHCPTEAQSDLCKEARAKGLVCQGDDADRLPECRELLQKYEITSPDGVPASASPDAALGVLLAAGGAAVVARRRPA